jgi:rhodanese-related sulfurtransferase
MVRRRKGRPRKTGARHKSGRLKTVSDPADSPRAIAARMPHRRGLAEPLDPRAESELGRMRLRGEVSEPEETAGAVYARMWRGYVSTLSAPRAPGEGQARVAACDGCSDPERRKYCACDMRRRVYAEAAQVLVSAGAGVCPLVHAVVILDRRCSDDSLPALKLGLSALATHYGLTRPLTNQRKVGYQNARSPKHVTPTHSR